jgi:hypothetical protein
MIQYTLKLYLYVLYCTNIYKTTFLPDEFLSLSLFLFKYYVHKSNNEIPFLTLVFMSANYMAL